jgi:hypothetical protein
VLAQAPAAVETEPRPATLSVSVPAAPAAVNDAVTVRAEVMVTVQVEAVPEHEPPQPANVAPLEGVSVIVADVPGAKVAVQVAPPVPQLIPPPETRPGPLAVTVSAKVLVPPENDAVTVFAALKVTVQVGVVPVQVPPPQPENVAPVDGVAVSVAVELAACPALVQVVAPDPQLIPPPDTVPFPVTDTVRANPAVPPVKVAVTFLDWLIETVQVVAVPPQAPVQPVKVAPVAGVATSETVAPEAKLAEQMPAPPPQLIAPLPPVTLPLPLIATERTFACVKVAVTAAPVAPIVTVQVGLVPVHPPVQPENT